MSGPEKMGDTLRRLFPPPAQDANPSPPPAQDANPSLPFANPAPSDSAKLLAVVVPLTPTGVKMGSACKPKGDPGMEWTDGRP